MSTSDKVKAYVKSLSPISIKDYDLVQFYGNKNIKYIVDRKEEEEDGNGNGEEGKDQECLKRGYPTEFEFLEGGKVSVIISEVDYQPEEKLKNGPIKDGVFVIS